MFRVLVPLFALALLSCSTGTTVQVFSTVKLSALIDDYPVLSASETDEIATMIAVSGQRPVTAADIRQAENIVDESLVRLSRIKGLLYKHTESISADQFQELNLAYQRWYSYITQVPYSLSLIVNFPEVVSREESLDKKLLELERTIAATKDQPATLRPKEVLAFRSDQNDPPAELSLAKSRDQRRRQSQNLSQQIVNSLDSTFSRSTIAVTNEQREQMLAKSWQDPDMPDVAKIEQLYAENKSISGLFSNYSDVAAQYYSRKRHSTKTTVPIDSISFNEGYLASTVAYGVKSPPRVGKLDSEFALAPYSASLDDEFFLGSIPIAQNKLATPPPFLLADTFNITDEEITLAFYDELDLEYKEDLGQGELIASVSDDDILNSQEATPELAIDQPAPTDLSAQIDSQTPLPLDDALEDNDMPQPIPNFPYQDSQTVISGPNGLREETEDDSDRKAIDDDTDVQNDQEVASNDQPPAQDLSAQADSQTLPPFDDVGEGDEAPQPVPDFPDQDRPTVISGPNASREKSESKPNQDDAGNDNIGDTQNDVPILPKLIPFGNVVRTKNNQKATTGTNPGLTPQDEPPLTSDISDARTDQRQVQSSDQGKITPTASSPKRERNWSRLNFDFNSAQLTPTAMQFLDILIYRYNTLKQQENVRLVVSAYTDTSGTKSYNKLLSEKRSESVRNYLTQQGIDSDNITLFAFGEKSNLNDKGDGKPCKDNRRVDVVVGNKVFSSPSQLAS